MNIRRLLFSCFMMGVISQLNAQPLGPRGVRAEGASPGPLFGFGQNIIRENQFISALYMESRGTLQGETFEVDPYLIYGVTERASVLALIPLLFTRDGPNKSQGIGDVLVQGEYALYNHQHDRTLNQWTAVGTVLFPTAGGSSIEPLDRQAYGLFLGTTTSHTSEKWYVYASCGGLLPSKNRETSYGSVFLYEYGFGFPLLSRKKSYLSVLFEMNGRFHTRDRDRATDSFIDGTGFNTIFFGPVLYYVRKNLTIQLGFQYPFTQRRFDNQPLNDFRVGLFIGYSS